MMIYELNNRSYNAFISDNSELCFEFSNFEINLSIDFVDTSLDLNIFKTFDLVSDYLDFFEKNEVKILSVNISHYENLGYREDISIYSKPQSISFQMFTYLRMLNEKYGNIVKDYGIFFNESRDAICPIEPNYSFKIEIDIGDNYIVNLINDLENIEIDFSIPFFYKKSYNIVPFEDSSYPKILTTNTKTRRLGYFKLLSEFIQKEKKIPESRVYKKFEKFAASFESQLIDYKDDKGRIKETKTGISALPYISLAENLELLTKINKIYSEGKKNKVYSFVKNRIAKNTSNNIFELSFFDKLFFLERILEKDFLYFSVLLELIFIKNSISFDELKSVFQNKILNRLKHYLEDDRIKAGAKREIQKIRKRILNWKKPDVYLEHIIMPKLNWLLDLNFIVYDGNKNYTTSKAGEVFFSNLCCWYDIETAFIVDPHQYIKRFIQHSFVYSQKGISKMDEKRIKLIESYIDIYIDESFSAFKTLAPNRTTLSQAVNYTKYMIFLKEEIPVEYQYIVNYLKKTDKYVYKYQSQYKDGYIQKR